MSALDTFIRRNDQYEVVCLKDDWFVIETIEGKPDSLPLISRVSPKFPEEIDLHKWFSGSLGKICRSSTRYERLSVDSIARAVAGSDYEELRQSGRTYILPWEGVFSLRDFITQEPGFFIHKNGGGVALCRFHRVSFKHVGYEVSSRVADEAALACWFANYKGRLIDGDLVFMTTGDHQELLAELIMADGSELKVFPDPDGEGYVLAQCNFNTNQAEIKSPAMSSTSFLTAWYVRNRHNLRTIRKCNMGVSETV